MKHLLGLLLVGMAMLAGPVQAQHASKGKVMLVLDASGSMWGRVEDREKILIAREVIGNMLDDWDKDIELGLVAYGHRRKGDCGDIETLVPVSSNTVNSIRSRVNALQPKGKTPLSAAVLQAAEALKYSEDQATVILVSDGKETCDLDPCEVGRKLEQVGVNFTAHVIGFDVKQEERAGLQCLASETGGQYYDAQRAEQLGEALSAAVKQVKASPDLVIAVLGPGGKRYNNVNIRWQIVSAAGETTDASGGFAHLPLEPGSYTVRASLGDVRGEASFDVLTAESVTHELVLDAARIKLKAEAELAGRPVQQPKVNWNLESEALAQSVNIRETANTEVILPMGAYVVTGDLDGTAQSAAFDVEAGIPQTVLLQFTLLPASLAAEDTALAGSEVDVTWEGPDNEGDYVTISDPEQDDPRYLNRKYTSKGSPLTLRMPDEPGIYEFRYFAGQSNAILARRAIEVTQATASLAAPDQAGMSQTVAVEWTGPDHDGDYITVVPVDAEDRIYKRYAYTHTGNPVKLRVPDSPGQYEFRYRTGLSGKILARKPIEVTEIATTIEAVDTATVSETIEISWTGPDAEGDYLTVVPVDANDKKYGKYQYTKVGSPLELLMPDIPGSYEIRYLSAGASNVLSRKPIQIEDIAATIEAPTEAPTGREVEVSWTGPNGPRDYITVVPTDVDDRKYGKYFYTTSESPAKLLMPDAPGSYEIRYVTGQSKTVLVRHAIEITSFAVSLDAPETAPAGSQVNITWTGPDGSRDLITIVPPDAPKGKVFAYKYTADGSPSALTVPDQPGIYEIRYVTGQSKEIAGMRTIEATPVTAILQTLDLAPANKTTTVYWSGPGNPRDRIVIAELSAPDNKYLLNIKPIKNPVKLRTPKSPGDYEIRYLTGQTYQPLARNIIRVVPEESLELELKQLVPGKVTFNAIGQQSGNALTENNRWQVYVIEGVKGEVIKSVDPSPQLTLAPGFYRVNLSANGASASTEFLVNAAMEHIVLVEVSGN